MSEQPVEVKIHRDQRPVLLIAIIGICLALACLGAVVAITAWTAESNHRHNVNEAVLRSLENKNAEQQAAIDKQNAQLQHEARMIAALIVGAEHKVGSSIDKNRAELVTLTKELNAQGIHVTVPPPLTQGSTG